MILGIEAAQVYALVSIVIKNFTMFVIAFIAAFVIMVGLTDLCVNRLKSYKIAKFLYDKEVEVMFGIGFIVYLILILIWGYN
jgi:quinol-cytochrome oxidoreductase complex cytochrome b subunit